MSEILPRPPQGDREPLFWRAIPLDTPPFRHALVATCLALAVGLGLRLVVLGFSVGFGAFSPWNPPHDLPRQGTLALFGLSGGVPLVAASALRTALVRLRRGRREPPRGEARFHALAERDEAVGARGQSLPIQFWLRPAEQGSTTPLPLLLTCSISGEAPGRSSP